MLCECLCCFLAPGGGESAGLSMSSSLRSRFFELIIGQGGGVALSRAGDPSIDASLLGLLLLLFGWELVCCLGGGGGGGFMVELEGAGLERDESDMTSITSSLRFWASFPGSFWDVPARPTSPSELLLSNVKCATVSRNENFWEYVEQICV